MSERHENGSAEAATSPSRGSNNPKQETAMNGAQYRPADGGSSTSCAFVAALSRIGNVDEVSSLPMVELRDLRSALRIISELTLGVKGQPRFMKRNGEDNAAGELLQAVMDVLEGYADVIVEEVRGRFPGSSEDAEFQAEVLVIAEIECGSNWSDIAHEASVGASRVRGMARAL